MVMGKKRAIKKGKEETLRTEYQYAAKVLCSLLGTFGDGFLARGVYRTVINVHNPTDRTIKFARKVVLAEQIGSPPSSISPTPFRLATLPPDGAVQIDCGHIANFFCPTPDGFCFDFSAIDGFLVIHSPVELDVVAVVTARPTRGGVQAVDIEYLQPRKLHKWIRVKTDQPVPKIKKRVKRNDF